MTSQFQKIFFLLFIIVSLSYKSFAQQEKVVHLISAEKLMNAQKDDITYRKFVGDVIFKIDSTLFYCDTAYVNDLKNDFDAYGHIKVKMSDTLNLYGDIIHYFGDSKIANIYHNVRLVDNETVLTTDKLKFDRVSEIASYTTGGEIVDSTNRLVSKKGFYNTKNHEVTFKENVRIFNPDYTVTSDTLMYNTDSRIINFRGPSWIKSDENTMYSENGWYNTLSDIGQFNEKAFIDNGKQIIKGDSLYYDRKIDFAKAINNVFIKDTVKKVIITGNYSEYNSLNQYAFVTDSAQAIFLSSNDSLFLHADSLKAIFDTTNTLQKIHAHYKTKFFQKGIQGKCDSLIYNTNDSIISMYKTPILWAKDSQITADSILIKMHEEELDYMELYKKCMIISHDTLDDYNQIKGKYMKAFFKNNALSKINADGNAETIYYLRDEEMKLIGVNKSVSSSMIIRFKNNKLNWITFIKNPKGEALPQKDITEEQRFFKEFEWLENKKPKNRFEIF